MFQESSTSLQNRSSVLPGLLYNFSVHCVQPCKSHTSCLGFKKMATGERRSRDCSSIVHFGLECFFGSFLRWWKLYRKVWCNRAWVWSHWALWPYKFFFLIILNFQPKSFTQNSEVTLSFSRQARWSVVGTLPQVIWNICATHSNSKTENLQFASRPVLLGIVIGFWISG